MEIKMAENAPTDGQLAAARRALTAAQAIERISEYTGILHATGTRAARAMRVSDARLWPWGSAGRGRAARVEPHHLVNLVVALAASTPADAPFVVAKMRRESTALADLDGLIGELATIPADKRSLMGVDDIVIEMDRPANAPASIIKTATIPAKLICLLADLCATQAAPGAGS